MQLYAMLLRLNFSIPVREENRDGCMLFITIFNTQTLKMMALKPRGANTGSVYRAVRLIVFQKLPHRYSCITLYFYFCVI